MKKQTKKVPRNTSALAAKSRNKYYICDNDGFERVQESEEIIDDWIYIK